MDLLFLIAVFVGGCFVGWHFPQPVWVKKVVDKVDDRI
jgi:polyferredoxin